MDESAVLKGTIDCDANPWAPNGLKVKRQKNGGIITVERCGGTLFTNGAEVELYISERQRAGQDDVLIPEVIDEIAEKRVLNACVLDYLLDHQEFIPESWKKDENDYPINIFFLGTIYQNKRHWDYIRGMYWSQYDEVWKSIFSCVAFWAPWEDPNPALANFWEQHFRAAVCKR